MADKSKSSGTVTIVIKGSGSSTSTASGNSATTADDATDSRSTKATDILNLIAHPLSSANNRIKELYGAAAGYAASQLVSMAGNMIRTSVEYNYNKQFQLSANYVARRDVDYATNAIQGGISLGQSVLGSAVAGFAVGGAVGAAIGALSTVGYSAIMGGIKSGQSYDQQRIAVAVNNTETAFARSRYTSGDGDDWGRGTDN